MRLRYKHKTVSGTQFKTLILPSLTTEIIFISLPLSIFFSQFAPPPLIRAFCALSLFPGAGEADESAPLGAVSGEPPWWEKSFFLGKVGC